MFSTACFMLCSVISSGSHAECTINSKFHNGNVISTIFREKGYELKNYESICQKLKKANVGLKINTQSMITTEQTTAAVMVRLYPIELAQKYDLLLSTSSSSTGMNANSDKTSSSAKYLEYTTLMGAIENADFDTMISEVNQIRNLVNP